MSARTYWTHNNPQLKVEARPISLKLEDAEPAIRTSGSNSDWQVVKANLEAQLAQALDEKTNAEQALAALRNEVNGLKGESAKAQEDLKHEITAMGEEHRQTTAALRKEAQTATDECNELHKAIKDLENELEQEAYENKNLHDEKAQLLETIAALEGQIRGLSSDEMRQQTEELVRVSLVCQSRMKKAENTGSPPLGELLSVCNTSENLFALLGDNPVAKTVLNDVLYLPMRTTFLGDGNVLAWGPVARYDSTTNEWRRGVGSDLRRHAKSTKEVFLSAPGALHSIIYAGTFTCVDLRSATSFKNIHMMPLGVDDKTLFEIASDGSSLANYKQLIDMQFRKHGLPIEASGLQCVGFNWRLYDALFPSRKGKHTAGAEGLGKLPSAAGAAGENEHRSTDKKRKLDPTDDAEESSETKKTKSAKKSA
ncbi:hypothetical protein C8F01DRAFT_1251773 [Mycena amicta]|nr:hypothetical protein C8F01DRAFT_1251773 [Mycena amicta]